MRKVLLTVLSNVALYGAIGWLLASVLITLTPLAIIHIGPPIVLLVIAIATASAASTRETSDPDLTEWEGNT